MSRIAIVMYGPPGSGKGTQANLLADKLGLIHFDTGRFLESVVHDPSRQKEAVIRKERKLFDAGILMSPPFVLREVSRAVERIAKAGWGVIFSGSPRTLYEAEGLIPKLEKLYGKRNVSVFVLNIPRAISASRNGRRVVCKICSAPLLTAYYPSKKYKHCPVCAGPFYRRTLDDPKVIGVRLKEYENRTKPVFTFLKKRGYTFHKVDGKPAPYVVNKKILSFFQG